MFITNNTYITKLIIFAIALSKMKHYLSLSIQYHLLGKTLFDRFQPLKKTE